MASIANNNRANYWASNSFRKRNFSTSENCGTENVFSTVPKVTLQGELIVFENCVHFNHPLQPISYCIPPERSENDIKKFSDKSRKLLFNIFNTLNYSEYGIPCFISATWHYDAPENRTSIKKFLANYIKRLKDSLPKFHAIWKLEYQKRGVPHLHFILLPLNKTEKIFTTQNELKIKSNWINWKQCKCNHCAEHSIKVIEVYNYEMAISYISKEIAKVQDRYEDHDLGRVWGTSQNLRCNHLIKIPCTTEQYGKIIDRKLEEKFRHENQKLYINGIRWLEQNSTIFINHKKISDLILDIQGAKKIPQLTYQRYKLKRKLEHGTNM